MPSPKSKRKQAVKADQRLAFYANILGMMSYSKARDVEDFKALAAKALLNRR